MQLTLRKMLHNLGALTDLSAQISSTQNFEEVTRASLHTLLGTLAIPRGAIARFTERPRQLKVVAAKGLGGAVGEKITLDRDEVERLASRMRPIALAETRNGLAHFVARNGDAFERLRVRIFVPMIARGELMGLIFLSDKFTREPYSEEDTDIIAAISQHIAIAFYNHRLLSSLKRKAEENRRLYREMRHIYRDTVRAFGAAIDLKDAYTSGHSDRVAKYAEAIAREMGLTGQSLEYVGVAGYLHDIGKITVDRAIINNPRPLTDREFGELNKHATTGYEILANIRHPWDEIAYMTKCHHEKFDGTGYPGGLRGDEIPLGSKIVTLADAFDAMMTDRPYRSRLPLERALSEMRRYTGKQFAPEVVAGFCRLLLKEIQGLTRERVIIPMIGLKFDREATTAELNSMLAEMGFARPKHRTAAS
ncbi:MAG TPA: HD domain-containing phosphohydrolase [Blastocatellia bacterium]|jgi:putative nucleotidyltransferase with HDIG domain|nr:HD domain-containing phosphohydrolase [Blastocatellia bacterium]